jgi:hypothetical protein
VLSAIEAISRTGTEEQKELIKELFESEIMIRIQPVSRVNASGVTGLIDSSRTSKRISEGPMGRSEALGEICITIAEETIDTGGARGCEGTLIHEGKHALDFAEMLSSYSSAEVNPLSLFDPTLYQLEYAAHKISGEYMLAVGKEDYLAEGLSLKILKQQENDGSCCLDQDGIIKRLLESYGLKEGEKEGPRASELLGLRI